MSFTFQRCEWGIGNWGGDVDDDHDCDYDEVEHGNGEPWPGAWACLQRVEGFPLTFLL